ncbi:MAG: hypothetical protein SP1CHLAM54_14450 [Chlamydiia bacterium]|nr:hypothetical protein [Chlamydiia bacterium]MCH9616337.1 hypothetical protein [Chlamydiia bacterium]MCH9629677.1 hypothetical protein [Chlamydiia bacterium]
MTVCAKPARGAGQVIYREPAFWSSHLWINQGTKHGVKPNASVLKDGALIGLVDLVERKKSRVRLLTDANLIPAVRVKRGESQNRLLKEQIKTLAANLESSGIDAAPLNQLTLKTSSNDDYLAKGELRGTSQALWRSRSHILKGVGFNYDFADNEGPARDLITGQVGFDTKTAKPLIQEGDLLVTTGLDGVFPKELPVAIVTHVEPLKDGAVSYDIKAKMVAGNLDEVDNVTLIVP